MLFNKRLTALLASVILAAAPALAEEAPDTTPSKAPAVTEQDSRQACEQKDQAYVAFLACSKLLMSPDLDKAAKVRITERRAQASLVLFYFAEAAEDFTDVLAAEPGNLDALRGRAEALSENSEFEKSAEDWAQVASKRPDDIPSRIHLGKNLYAAGMFDKAAAAYQEAVALDNKNGVAYVGLAQALDMLDQRDKADESIAAALKLNPENTSALMAKGEMAERRGNTQVAIESYMLSLKANGMQVKPRKALQRLGIETPP